MKKPLAGLFIAFILGILATGCSESISPGAPPSGGTTNTATTNANAGGEAVLLELTYPGGESPKVFTTGWVFGAKCLLNPGTESEQDISSQVKWSGDAVFQPAVGNESRPEFKKTGNNVIILEINTGQETVRKQYTVTAVDPGKYAHVGDNARCPADTHGCPACPHDVIGPILTGSPTVTVNGLPAARVGDTGVHSACCGPNTFEIVTGDPEVIIDGRPAARNGDKTKHCGGIGYIICVETVGSSNEKTTPSATATPSTSPTKSVSPLTVTGLRGTIGLEDYGGQQVAVYISGGKAPYIYEFGGTEILFSGESGGTSYQIVTTKSKFIVDGNTYLVWVTVKDANGQYATWTDADGKIQTKFVFGYKRNANDTGWVIFTEPEGLY